jgi:hypothetical protein
MEMGKGTESQRISILRRKMKRTLLRKQQITGIAENAIFEH